MIRSLRRRHGAILLGLAAVVPLLAVVALLARPTLPIGPAPIPAPTTDEWTALLSEGRVRALIESDGGREWLHLKRNPALIAPDVLVYWTSAIPRQRGGPGDDAVLLGPLGDAGTHTYDLPLRETPGVVLLYSLGHATVVGSTPVGSIARLDRGR